MEKVKHFFENVSPNAQVVYVIGDEYYVNPVPNSTPVTRAEALEVKKQITKPKKNKD